MNCGCAYDGCEYIIDYRASSLSGLLGSEGELDVRLPGRVHDASDAALWRS